MVLLTSQPRSSVCVDLSTREAKAFCKCCTFSCKVEKENYNNGKPCASMLIFPAY